MFIDVGGPTRFLSSGGAQYPGNENIPLLRSWIVSFYAWSYKHLAALRPSGWAQLSHHSVSSAIDFQTELA